MLKLNIWVKFQKKSAKDKINQLESIDEFQEEYIDKKRIKLTFVGEISDNNMPKNNGFSKKQLEQLQELLRPIQNDINELKTDVCVLKSDVSEIKNDVTVLKKDVSKLKEDVAKLKEDVNGLKNDTRSIKSRLDVVEKDIKDIKRCPTIQRELKQIV